MIYEKLFIQSRGKGENGVPDAEPLESGSAGERQANKADLARPRQRDDAVELFWRPWTIIDKAA